MIANTFFAASALVSLVAAVPMAQPPFPKRDIVWETETEVALTTIPVTVTHWLEPGETPPTDAGVNKQHYGHHGGHGHGKPPAQPETTATSVPVVPVSSPEAPAPAPSSYEQPAPPPAAPTTPTQPAYTPEPAPETTQQAPSPAYTPEPQPSPQPAPSQPSSGGGSSGGSGSGLSGMAAPGKQYTGDLTYYNPGLGSCGQTSTSSEAIVAISEAIFDSYDNGNPNNNPLCGKMVSITGEDGSSYEAKIVDRCPGCAEADLDLSPDFFKKVVPTGDGRVPGVKWTFA